MAFWSTHSSQNHDVYTVVYLLKDALQSALDDAWFFERTTCSKPNVIGAGHAEIAARLGRFRTTCNGLKEREALMLTKLLRARSWAVQLRKHCVELQDDVDQFMDATEQCQKLQSEFVRDKQRMFNGGESLSRFMSQRQGDDGVLPNNGQTRDYLVGGQTALFELRAACEVFLSQINQEFFSKAAVAPSDEVAYSPDNAFMAYLEAAEEKSHSVH